MVCGQPALQGEHIPNVRCRNAVELECAGEPSRRENERQQHPAKRVSLSKVITSRPLPRDTQDRAGTELGRALAGSVRTPLPQRGGGGLHPPPVQRKTRPKAPEKFWGSTEPPHLHFRAFQQWQKIGQKCVEKLQLPKLCAFALCSNLVLRGRENFGSGGGPRPPGGGPAASLHKANACLVPWRAKDMTCRDPVEFQENFPHSFLSVVSLITTQAAIQRRHFPCWPFVGRGSDTFRGPYQKGEGLELTPNPFLGGTGDLWGSVGKPGGGPTHPP